MKVLAVVLSALLLLGCAKEPEIICVEYVDGGGSCHRVEK